ncbi:5-formyltetrahydrofolate cyclo-ligase [Paenibacillus abyssi]|uniref:5-formyltetrahydrofolate cyclo-ligase n=1 Tax=Paenibacillus abyssi TaxID=1340531 RepID=A0A917G405_9BACL|nr:5-formyltetrahydrofolate cyclo-ligase [Paenibacillus abyssi]GGG21308.1 5-formyltetrahydrofolate cyclo-ligase [Paenibacillus abyssi]
MAINGKLEAIKQDESVAIITMEESGASVQKQAIRQHMNRLRNGITEEHRSEWSRLICNRAAEWLQASGGKNVMLYVAFRSEVDTRPLVEWAWQAGLTVIVPLSDPLSRTMTLYELRDWSELRPGAYGILEPDPGKAAVCSEDFVPDAVFVPGLSFDTAGGRLGYGGGYYDRFRERLLSKLGPGRPMPCWIGLAFEAQLADRIPREPHDANVDAVMTERTLYANSQYTCKGGFL